MKKYYSSLGILRGITITLVIIGHSVIVYPIDISGVKICKNIQEFIYYFHMEFFFLLAGMCYTKVSYGDLLVKKIKRLLVPYVVFAFTSVLLHSFGSFVNGNESISDGIWNLILYGGGYWFLYVLFEIYLCYPILEKIGEKSNILFGMILLLLLLLSGKVGNNIFCIKYCLYYMPFFMCGHILNKIKICEYFEALKIPLAKRYSILGIGGCAIAYGLYCYGIHNIVLQFAGVVSLFLSSVCYLSVLSIKNKIIKKYFVIAGKYSLQMYLFNGYLLVVAREILVRLCHITNPYVLLIFISLSNCLGAIFIAEFIVGRVRVLRFLCGMKGIYNQ